MEHGRLGGCDRDTLLGEMGGCSGLGGGRGPLYGSHNHCSRDGERFGWGREGRVRLDDLPTHHRRPNSLGGLTGGVGGLNLGGGEGPLGSMGGGLGGRGPMRAGPFDGLENRGSPLLRRGLDAAFMDPRDNPYLFHELSLGGIHSRDRLGSGRPFLPGGMGMGLGLGLGGRSRTPSLRGSNYSLDHLDRRPRPYHYQPPYVEDWESILEEELLRPEMMELLERRNDIMHGADLYGLPAGYDLEDLMGGMGGRRGRL